MRRYTHGPAIRAVDSCARSGQISAHAAGQAWQKPAAAHVGEEANACFRHGESCSLSRDAIPRGKGYANAATHCDAVDECHNGLFIDEQQMVHPVFVEIKAFSLDTVGLGAVRQQANIAEIGSAHVRTPVTNSHLVCSLLLEKKK